MNTKLPKNKKALISSLSDWMFPLLILAVFFLLLIFSDTAINYMKKGLALCAVAVIPSLFPFMVISDLTVRSGIGIKVSRVLRFPMRLLFGVNEAGASAYILGALCGFPIGALTLVKTYEKGEMSKCELERLMTFCNNPGSAFVISAVGVSLMGDKRIGILIYTSVLLSSVLIGIACRFIYPKATRIHTKESQSKVGLSATDFTDSMRSSALSMLGVCSYVVFFSSIIGCVGAIVKMLGAPDELTATIFGFFELSSGVSAASAVGNRETATVLCALFTGWSGLSVHFQIMSVCMGNDISFKPFIIAKAVQGILCATFTYIVIKLFPSLLVCDSDVLFQKDHISFSTWSVMSLALFAMAVLILLYKKAPTSAKLRRKRIFKK